MRGTTSSTHSSVYNPLEGLVSPLKWVLVLIIWFASPNLDPEHSQIVKDLVAIMAGSTITNDSFRGSPGCNESLQRVR